MPTRIVMIGTAFETRGGIASVLGSYRAAGLFVRWPIDYVATHCDGTAMAKLACAARGFLTVLWLAFRHPRAVLHVHAASRASFWRKSVFMALARLAGWPIVFHLHGGGFARFHDQECGAPGRRVVRYFLDRAACIVVVSEGWGQWMRSATRNPNVVCIPNPVSTPPSPRPLGTDHSSRPDVLCPPGALVTFIGRCEEGKGVFDLLEAVNALRATLPSIRLECAGDGDLEALARRAAELGMRAHLHLPGWIAHGARDELLARTSVFVLPSHAEGMPVALLEAMAAGCPVVASSVGGIPDLVTHEMNGLLVAPGDRDGLALAIGRVLADGRLAARLGSAARATVEHRHTVEHSLEALERIYSSLGVGRTAAQPVAMPRRLQEIS